jgi:hypothetical protein
MNSPAVAMAVSKPPGHSLQVFYEMKKYLSNT